MKTKSGNGVPIEAYDVRPCLMELEALVQRTWEPGIRFELHAPLAMPAGTEIRIRITDNGLGMTRDTLHQAVDPFFTTKAGGMGGHGLPIVVHFVQETGGRLQIESEPGIGTVVTLSLPVPVRSERPH